MLDGRSQPLGFFAGGTLAGLVAALADVGIVGLGPQVTHTLLGLFQVFFQLGLTAEGIRAGTGATFMPSWAVVSTSTSPSFMRQASDWDSRRSSRSACWVRKSESMW